MVDEATPDSADSEDDVELDVELDVGDIDIDFGLDDDTAEDAATEVAAEDDVAIDLSDDIDMNLDDATVVTSNSSDDDDFDLSSLDDVDEISTKLDLARAYLDMGDNEGTKGILEEVIADGNDEQKQEANELMAKLD